MRSSPSLRTLRDTGLPVDWMMVYVGWRGLSGPYSTYGLPASEVIDFAYDCLGASPPEQVDAVFRIADAEPNYAGVDRERRFLEQSARQSGVSEQTALRKWRLAGAVEVQDSVTYWLRGEGRRDPDYAIYAAHDLYDFDIFWREGIEALLLPDFGYIAAMSDIEQASRRFDAWVAEEKAALASPDSRGPATSGS